MARRFQLPSLLLAGFCVIAWGDARAAADSAPRQLLPPAAAGLPQLISATSTDVSFLGEAGGLAVTCKPGKEGYPGVVFKSPEAQPFDFSSFGHVEARIANTGSTPIGLTLRIDDDREWNAGNLSLKPGEAGTLRVLFGYTWGQRGYALRSNKVTRVHIFVNKGKAEQSFRIESLQAGGKPGESPADDPKLSRAKPKDGAILSAGAARLDPAKQIDAHNATATVEDAAGALSLRITFPANAPGESAVRLKPEIGRWDLSDYLELRVRLANDGKSPVMPKLQLESNGSSNGPSQIVAAASPVVPGAAVEMVLPFSHGVWRGTPETTTKYGSATTSAVVILADKADVARSIRVTSIRAVLPPPPALPAWLGKRPPVEGEWTQTFADDFDGSAVDASKWNVKHPNYWDQPSHFSPQNVIVAGGAARLRYGKKRGHHDDDPKQRITDYATGYLDTMNKFAQRYGYFEARMKLPTAPGLWPAFWLMPDRGQNAKNRQGTNEGGMEFDIMEGQSRWGPNRYNIAMHWDGYGKSHKAVGTDNLYVRPDKEGYITSGLLWTPGSAVYYCNGVEIARWENERVGSVPALMMFTLPQGGWDNDEVDDGKLPDDFVIDYVRVWQRANLVKGP